MDPEIPGHLSDRLTGLPHDPDRALRNSGSYFRRVSGIATPLGDASTLRGDARIFHSDKGGEYTGDVFANVCTVLG